jgi:hypothetical protein
MAVRPNESKSEFPFSVQLNYPENRVGHLVNLNISPTSVPKHPSKNSLSSPNHLTALQRAIWNELQYGTKRACVITQKTQQEAAAICQIENIF